MSRTLELRLAKLETSHIPSRLVHEDWLEIIKDSSPMTEVESAAMDARIEAEALAQHGSLSAAAAAARTKATRTRDLFDDFLAIDLECRAAKEAHHALA